MSLVEEKTEKGKMVTSVPVVHCVVKVVGNEVDVEAVVKAPKDNAVHPGHGHTKDANEPALNAFSMPHTPCATATPGGHPTSPPTAASPSVHKKDPLWTLRTYRAVTSITLSGHSVG